MTTSIKGEESAAQTRYFISSLPQDVEQAARTILRHWMVEICHWHLGVTFRENANGTVDKAAAYNLNIIKKMALNTLRLVDVDIATISLKNKRLVLCMNFSRYLDAIILL